GFEVSVVAEAGKPAGIGDARLVRIYLPGVEVENLWFGLIETGPFEQPARQRVRVLPEIPASRSRYGLTQHLGSGQRKFCQAGAAAGDDGIGLLRTARDAVVIVARGEDTGVPGKSQVRQGIQRPERPAGDGVTGGAIAGNRRLDDVLKDLLGPGRFVTKDLRRLPVDQLVAITVGGDLVALRLDAPDQLWVAFRHPAEDKEGDPDPGVIEQLQQLFRIFFYSRGPLSPFRRLDDIGEGRNLVV